MSISLRTMIGVPGFAVGAGIARSIAAHASDPENETPEGWVHFCITAADEAYAAVMDAPPTMRREVSSAVRLLRKLDRIGENPTDEPETPQRLWEDLWEDERDRAERNGWTAAGWNQSQRRSSSTNEPEDDPESTYEDVTLDGTALANAAQGAASVAFRACMPKLVGRRATQAYIACVAVGVQRGYFTGGESKALLYTAQLALSAHPKRTTQPRPTAAPARRKVGFNATPTPHPPA